MHTESIMGIRTTVKLFLDTLNDLLRTALVGIDNKPRHRVLVIKPTPMGHKPGLNYDNIESLIEYGESERHR
jgi:hypothetical protein